MDSLVMTGAVPRKTIAMAIVSAMIRIERTRRIGASSERRTVV